jgi:hypothetical protein
MNVINHRKFQKLSGGPSKRVRQLRIAAALLIGLFVVANLAVAILYAGKTLPKQTVGGQNVSGVNYADVERLVKSYTLPATVTLNKDNRKETVPVDQFNMHIDVDKTMHDVKERPLLPLFALFEHRNTPLSLTASTRAISDKILILDASFSRAATDRRVAFDGNDFVIEDAKGGYTFDADATARSMVAAIAQGKTTAEVSVQTTPAGDNTGDLSKERDALRKQLDARITYKAGIKTTQTSKKDIGSLFEHAGRTMVVSDAAVSAYITQVTTQLGAGSASAGDAAIATRYAIEKAQNITFVLSGAHARTLTYCTVADGVAQSGLGDLKGKLAVAYGDPKGWNNNGAIAFRHVDSGCDYRVVLAAPAKMTSYGAICDDFYNCQVGNNVIVNNDRWLYATEPWNKTGQTLETYRLLIINHETGHRLGLRDYNVCSGAGQPAPIMMQQSIDLMGCAFNVWPLQSELDRL